MLSTGESLLGLSRHLSAYAMGPEKAALAQLQLAGQILDLSLRLRATGVSSAARVKAMALDAGLDSRTLGREVLPALESLGRIEVERKRDRSIVSISEFLPPIPELMAMAESFLAIVQPEPVEAAVMSVLDATTVMPLTVTAALEVGSKVSSDEDAKRALDYLEALHLCMRHQSADGQLVVFNPNIWSVDAVSTAAALRAEDGSVRAALSGLIEEVGRSAGLPEDSVQSTEKRWIDYAVAQGLLQRSLVVTTSGQEKAFLFSPHMNRSAFDKPLGVDPSGHVRQLIGSMVYARNYARFNLYSPAIFLDRLIRNGEAGDASSIATDYPMLEASGIFKIEPATNFHKIVLLKADVAEQALTYLDSPGTTEGSLSGLRDQRRWETPEAQRARMASTADSKPVETERLLAALRQEIGDRSYGR